MESNIRIALLDTVSKYCEPESKIDMKLCKQWVQEDYIKQSLKLIFTDANIPVKQISKEILQKSNILIAPVKLKQLAFYNGLHEA